MIDATPIQDIAAHLTACELQQLGQPLIKIEWQRYYQPERQPDAPQVYNAASSRESTAHCRHQYDERDHRAPWTVYQDRHQQQRSSEQAQHAVDRVRLIGRELKRNPFTVSLPKEPNKGGNDKGKVLIVGLFPLLMKEQPQHRGVSQEQ